VSRVQGPKDRGFGIHAGMIEEIAQRDEIGSHDDMGAKQRQRCVELVGDAAANG
jgi:hypothetical protein